MFEATAPRLLKAPPLTVTVLPTAKVEPALLVSVPVFRVASPPWVPAFVAVPPSSCKAALTVPAFLKIVPVWT